MRARFLIGIVITFGSCATTEPDMDVATFEAILQGNVVFDSGNSYVVVIPANGCNGCIKKSINFAVNGKHSDAVFVITGKSKKEMNLVIDDIDNFRNVVVDSAGWLFKNGMSSEFPQFFVIRNQVVVRRLELNGSNLDSVIHVLGGPTPDG
jgi:hypothetical protein